jgi:replicative DNA helicase
MKSKLVNYNLNDKDLIPLPSDDKLERMVLGLLIDVPTMIDPCMKYLKLEGIFYNDFHDQIWEAIKSVIYSQMVPNKKNVESFFTQRGNRDLAVMVQAMTIYAGDITMLRQYCLKLFEMAIYRNIIRLGHDLNTRGYDREDALKLLADGSNGIGFLYEAIAGMKAKSITDGVNELTDELAAIANSPDGMLGIKGSMPLLNHIIKGYRRGNMIVIGASSGEGKTTFALQEISHMVSHGYPVGVVSLEMTQSELLLKLACEKENILIEKALDGTMSLEETQRMGISLDRIKNMPLLISDTPGLKIGEVKATARMWKNRNKIKVLFIDHMHLIRGDQPYGSSEQQFTDIANQIKELAKELDIPVISLAQLARKELTEKRMHAMTDLKYAGGIEQAADVIIMIFRPEHHNILTDSEGMSTEGKAIIKVEKLRLLRPGIVKCQFDGLRFYQPQEQGFRHGQNTTTRLTPLKQLVNDEPF